jgi:hypothetical protein
MDSPSESWTFADIKDVSREPDKAVVVVSKFGHALEI